LYKTVQKLELVRNVFYVCVFSLDSESVQKNPAVPPPHAC